MINDDCLVQRDATPRMLFPDILPDNEDQDARSPKWFYPLVISILIGMAVATGVVVSLKTKAIPADQSQDATGTEAPGLDSLFESCDLEYLLFQCSDSISEQEATIPLCIQESFNEYRNNWIKTVDPKYNITNQDICHPSNKALIAVAYFAQEHMVNEIDLRNVYGLASYYFLLHGENWRDDTLWLSAKSIKEWLGVTVNGGGEVVGISLQNMFIEAEFPSLPPLATLKSLDLSFNKLRGSLPQNIGGLQDLNLENNFFSGSLPLVWTRSTDMRIIRVAANGITGTLPSSIGNMENLEVLSISSNGFDSTIPSEIGTCLSLRDLDLRQNQFMGTIPSELGLLNSLEHIDLGANSFANGIVPAELMLLTELVTLFLPACSLTGTVPTKIGKLVNLAFVDLSANELTGSLPSELGLLTNARHLYIEHNHLNGTVPSELGRLTSVLSLDISSNMLNGTLPKEMGLLVRLQDFVFWGNMFNGYIPYEICALWQDGKLQNFGGSIESEGCDSNTFGGSVCPYPECCRNCAGFQP